MTRDRARVRDHCAVTTGEPSGFRLCDLTGQCRKILIGERVSNAITCLRHRNHRRLDRASAITAATSYPRSLVHHIPFPATYDNAAQGQGRGRQVQRVRPRKTHHFHPPNLECPYPPFPVPCSRAKGRKSLALVAESGKRATQLAVEYRSVGPKGIEVNCAPRSPSRSRR